MNRAFSRRFSSWLYLLSAIGCLTVLVYRCFQIFYLHAPFQGDLFGREDETLFALWRWNRALPLYIDLHSTPFAAAYFNWFFYLLYGSFTSTLLSVLQLDDFWIPHIARILSLCLQLATVVLFFLATKSTNTPRVLRLALGVFVAFSPLFDYSAIAARPEPLSIFLLLAAMLSYFSSERESSNIAILCCSLFVALAWLSKQTSLVLLCGIAAPLLLQLQWRKLLFLCLPLTFVVVFFLLFGSDVYLNSTFSDAAVGPYKLELGIEFLVQSIIFAAPTIGVLFFLHGRAIFNSRVREILWLESKDRSMSVCWLTMLLLLFAAAMKLGAASVYFLPLHVFSAVHLVQMYPRLCSSSITTSWNIAWLLSLVLAAVTLFRDPYTDTLVKNHFELLRSAKCVSSLPEPVFVDSAAASLPWLNPIPPYFVISREPSKQRHSRILENDYAALVQYRFPEQLVNYRLQSENTEDCRGFRVWVK